MGAWVVSDVCVVLITEGWLVSIARLNFNNNKIYDNALLARIESQRCHTGAASYQHPRWGWWWCQRVPWRYPHVMCLSPVANWIRRIDGFNVILLLRGFVEERFYCITQSEVMLCTEAFLVDLNGQGRRFLFRLWPRVSQFLFFDLLQNVKPADNIVVINLKTPRPAIQFEDGGVNGMPWLSFISADCKMRIISLPPHHQYNHPSSNRQVLPSQEDMVGNVDAQVGYNLQGGLQFTK